MTTEIEMRSVSSTAASECLRRAEVMTRLAEFIDARCQRFDCLCPHDDGSLHVYDEADAKAEFGALGWQHLYMTSSGLDYYGKTIGQTQITYQSRTPQVHTPSLPLL